MFLIKVSFLKVDFLLMLYRCWMILEFGIENGFIYFYIYIILLFILKIMLYLYIYIKQNFVKIIFVYKYFKEFKFYEL